MATWPATTEPARGVSDMVRVWSAGALLAVMVLLGPAGCTGSSPPARGGAASASQSSAGVAVSPPATEPSPGPTTQEPSAPGPAGPPPAPVTPNSVVLAYFQAINDHDYGRAWEFGGKNLGRPYGTFVQGFADTGYDAVTITRVAGTTVSVQLVAYHTDGSSHYYAGTYTVAGGVITGAHVVAVGGPSGTGTCGAPANPYGYGFCGRGGLIYSPPPDFCSYFACVGAFADGRGYVVQCVDGQFSRSGGRPGACSSHGGVRRPLYRGG